MPTVKQILAKCRAGMPINRAEADLLRKHGLRKDGQPIRYTGPKGLRAGVVTVDMIRALVDTLGPVPGMRRAREVYADHAKGAAQRFVKAREQAKSDDARAVAEAYQAVWPPVPAPNAGRHKVDDYSRVTIKVPDDLAKSGEYLKSRRVGDEIRLRVIRDSP